MPHPHLDESKVKLENANLRAELGFGVLPLLDEDEFEDSV